MDKERKIERIKERWFKVVRLGKHIRASRVMRFTLALLAMYLE